MIRRTTIHKATNSDYDSLQVVTIYEPGINKQHVKQENKYSKRHGFIIIDK